MPLNCNLLEWNWKPEVVDSLSDCWGVLVAAGGVVCDELKSRNIVAVSLLELSMWFSSQLVGKEGSNCADIRLKEVAGDLEGSIDVPRCEWLKRSHRNSIVTGCEVDFDLISRWLMDSASNFVNITKGIPPEQLTGGIFQFVIAHAPSLAFIRSPFLLNSWSCFHFANIDAIVPIPRLPWHVAWIAKGVREDMLEVFLSHAWSRIWLRDSVKVGFSFSDILYGERMRLGWTWRMSREARK